MNLEPVDLAVRRGRKLFHLEREHHTDAIALFLRSKYTAGDRVSIALPEPIQWRVYSAAEEAEYYNATQGVRPLLRLGRDEAQRLMDELWQVGLRPSEGAGSAGSLAATQRHLDDMRAIVFKSKPKTAV